MITNYERLLQLDAEERDTIHSAIEGAIADAVSSETLCDDVDYIETLRAFLKFLEEMQEIY